MTKWGGHRARTWTRDVLARGGRLCTLNLEGCTIIATTGDHIIPRSLRPDLEYDVTNGRPSCLHCNQKRGARPAPLIRRRDDRAFFTTETR